MADLFPGNGDQIGDPLHQSFIGHDRIARRARRHLDQLSRDIATSPLSTQRYEIKALGREQMDDALAWLRDHVADVRQSLGIDHHPSKECLS